jgi:hypothetical protein
VKDIAGT